MMTAGRHALLLGVLAVTVLYVYGHSGNSGNGNSDNGGSGSFPNGWPSLPDFDKDQWGKLSYYLKKLPYKQFFGMKFILNITGETCMPRWTHHKPGCWNPGWPWPWPGHGGGGKTTTKKPISTLRTTTGKPGSTAKTTTGKPTTTGKQTTTKYYTTPKTTTGRVTSTTGRVTSTTGRVTSTTGRVTSTTGRVTSTTGRVTSTTGRVTSTTGRVTSTTGRVTSTTGRVTSTAAQTSTTRAATTTTADQPTTTVAPTSTSTSTSTSTTTTPAVPTVQTTQSTPTTPSGGVETTTCPYTIDLIDVSYCRNILDSTRGEGPLRDCQKYYDNATIVQFYNECIQFQCKYQRAYKCYGTWTFVQNCSAYLTGDETAWPWRQQNSCPENSTPFPAITFTDIPTSTDEAAAKRSIEEADEQDDEDVLDDGTDEVAFGIKNNWCIPRIYSWWWRKHGGNWPGSGDGSHGDWPGNGDWSGNDDDDSKDNNSKGHDNSNNDDNSKGHDNSDDGDGPQSGGGVKPTKKPKTWQDWQSFWEKKW